MSMFTSKNKKKQKNSTIVKPLYSSNSVLDKKPKKHRRFIIWFKNLSKIKKIILITAILLVVSGLAAVLVIAFRPAPKPVVAPVVVRQPTKPLEKIYSNLNGIEVARAEDQTRPVTAVMIENSPSARPQSGLKDAEVVYEAIAEGGITRFLILFQQNKPALIGPVRSVRAYYVDWLTPFQASVAHVGGSAAALRTVRNGDYRDIDQFFNADTYYRANDRYAPHNVYTTSEKLDALNNQKGFTRSEFSPDNRADGKASEVLDASAVSISFGSPEFATQYQYDTTSNTYQRSIAGTPHLDREKGQIAPHVVIAMKVNEQTVMEDGYRQQIDTTAGGEATIFQNGTVIAAIWRKPTPQSRIEFTDASGKPLSLVRGQTWIAAVPNDGGTVTWQ